MVADIDGISSKLKVDVTKGIDGDSFTARTAFFGNNYREPLVAKTFCKIFCEALDDFMLKVLIVAATGSLIFEYIGADPEDYGHGKSWSPAAASAASQALNSRGSASGPARIQDGCVGRAAAPFHAII